MAAKKYEIYMHALAGMAYIGFTSTGWKKRWYSHLWMANIGSELPFYKAIREHGKENVVSQVLYDTDDMMDALRKEEEMIAKYDTYNNGYNMTPGGQGGGSKPREKCGNWKGQSREEVLDLACSVIVENEGYWVPSEYTERAKSMNYPVMFYSVFGENWREALLEHAKKKGIGIDSIETNFSEKMRSKLIESQQDYKWYSNHMTQTCKKFKPGKEIIPDGWVLGKFYIKPNQNSTVYYHPETRERRFIKPDEEIPDGFIKGVPSERTSLFGKKAFIDTGTGKVKYFAENEAVPENFESGAGNNMLGQKDKEGYHHVENREVKFFAPDEEIPKGWKKGLGKDSVIKGKTRYIHQENWNIKYFDPAKDEIPDGYSTEVPDGFVAPNSNKGKKVYTSLETGISKHFFPDKVPEGYVPGNPKAKNNSIKNKKVWHNPITGEEARVGENETPPPGFIKGRRKGKSTYYHPETGQHIHVFNTEIPPVGFIKGSLQKSNAGKQAWSDPTTGECHMIKIGDEVPGHYIKGNITKMKNKGEILKNAAKN